MTAWRLHASKLKTYPHFDPILKLIEVEALVTNPDRVATNAFFPFLQYSQNYMPFRHSPQTTGKDRINRKERRIMYACRRDAYIFSYYRNMLSELYEKELVRLGIQGCPIAYRRIPRHNGEVGGKSNIQFAKDAFLKIRELGNCCAIAVDISSYFDSIDHQRLKHLWCRLLGVERLPPDHMAVFKNITKYSYVDKMEVYERLGFYGQKSTTASGKIIKGYIIPKKYIKPQICLPTEFRIKILGKDGKAESLLKKNKESHGIPQGAPISDLLANLYLIDFDVEMNKLAVELGGSYLRYSDDILLVLPVPSNEAKKIMESLQDRIKKYGDQLIIKPSKSFLVRYTKQGDRQVAENIDLKRKTNGLEYLGFRYDGKDVHLRAATLSNLYRKISRSARRQAVATVKRYPNKKQDELFALFNFEEFVKKFGRVESFENAASKKNWTFWTYVKRSCKEFDPMGSKIGKQASRIRKNSKHKVRDAITSALKRKEKVNVESDP